jgi:uncharacterized protein with PQ loop repeat
MIKNIALLATLLGIIRYLPQYQKIQNDGNVSSHSKSYIILGIVTGILWGIYNRLTTRDNIAFFSIVVGIVFQLYILLKIIDYERQKLKNV